MFEPDACPIQVGDVISQKTAEAVVLFHVDSGQYFSLNEVGGRVWELADGTRNISAIAGIIAEEYNTPVESVEPDVLEVLEQLAAESLVAAR